MNNVAESVESDEIYRQVIEAQRTAARSGVSDAITVAAREVAETTQVKAICCFSHSGTTALLAARERPRVPIIALTPLIGTARRLALSWGLHCVVVPEVDRFKMAVVSAARAAREHGFASEDDRIVVTAGIPFGVAGLHQHPARRHLPTSGRSSRAAARTDHVPEPADRVHWSRAARDWIAWARAPGHDAFWHYRAGARRADRPRPGAALDVGCGEGRVARAAASSSATASPPPTPCRRWSTAAREAGLGRRLCRRAGRRHCPSPTPASISSSPTTC